MSVLADIHQRATDAMARDEVLTHMGLPPAEWQALLTELRGMGRYARGQTPEERDLGIPPPWEHPDPDEVTVHGPTGPISIVEAPPLVLRCPSWSATITGIDPQ